MAGEGSDQQRRLRFEGAVSIGLLLVAWQVASFFLPEYVIPGLELIAAEFVKMARAGTLISDTALTFYRIVQGLIAGFAVGALLGVVMGTLRKTESYLLPVVNLVMGIPALSWTLIVILWFRTTETRILVLMLAISFPVFAHTVLDAIKGISQELMQMTLVFRPTRLQILRKLILPSITPHVLTSWKVTTGFGVRVVIVAELVGASTGVGFRMLEQQSLLNMSGVLAWTLVLVFTGLGMQFVLARLESRLLRWRPSAL
jgi:ABC-type nitrate/sulfonate/bicarbonate transport system permease component